MPAMMFCPAAITAGRSSWSRRGSVAAMAGTMTWSRSRGSVPAGRAACAARPAARAAGRARQGSRPDSRPDGNSPVQSSSATSSKVRLTARRVASRPRNLRLSPVISVMADSTVMSATPAGRRGRPRRASCSTSSAPNKLVRPSGARTRLSTPRLT